MEAGMLHHWRFRDETPPPHHERTQLTAAPPGVASSATSDELTQLAHDAAITPLLARLLWQRGIRTSTQVKQFLAPKLTDLTDPRLIHDLDKAAQRIITAVREQQPIIIYGDYDVDGITASAILWHTLHAVGANVTSYVPHRVDEGYGLNSDALRSIITASVEKHAQLPCRGLPLIVSVDCGITAVEPAKVARELGAQLIITDHHQFDQANLPDAYALVHPGLEDVSASLDDSPDAQLARSHRRALCGAGVAYKLAWQIARLWCGSERVSDQYRRLLLDLLAFAALGTVADIVPLIGENRIIVQHGLGCIKRTSFAGLNALIDASNLRDEKIDSYHVGFVLGPRLNACGRMGHAAEAVHLLTQAQSEEAMTIAQQLTKANEQRRVTEKNIFHEACQMVLDQGFDQPDQRAIVLGKEGWHVGVVGIVASRLVEKFHRPVVLMSCQHGEAHGSARSIEAVSIHDAFTACKDHLKTFGGHRMAAGLKMDSARITIFRQAMVEYMNSHLRESDLVSVLKIDAEVELEELTLPTVRALERMAPFGQGNPSPRLCLRQVVLEDRAQLMGKSGKHLSVLIRQGRRVMRAVAFNMGEHAEQMQRGVVLDLIIEAHLSHWQGTQRVELHVQDFRLVKS